MTGSNNPFHGYQWCHWNNPFYSFLAFNWHPVLVSPPTLRFVAYLPHWTDRTWLHTFICTDYSVQYGTAFLHMLQHFVTFTQHFSYLHSSVELRQMHGTTCNIQTHRCWDTPNIKKWLLSLFSNNFNMLKRLKIIRHLKFISFYFTLAHNLNITLSLVT